MKLSQMGYSDEMVKKIRWLAELFNATSVEYMGMSIEEWDKITLKNNQENADRIFKK